MKSNQLESMKHLGHLGEEAFRNWLDQNGLRYIAIDQSPSTFARAFRGIAKRPDFMVFTEAIGEIAVEVKNYSQSDPRFRTLNLKAECEKSLEFERLTGKAVFYAFYVDEFSWAWISSKNARERAKLVDNEGSQFLSICVHEFQTIRCQTDLEHMLQEECEIELCYG